MTTPDKSVDQNIMSQEELISELVGIIKSYRSRYLLRIDRNAVKRKLDNYPSETLKGILPSLRAKIEKESRAIFQSMPPSGGGIITGGMANDSLRVLIELIEEKIVVDT